MVFSVIAQRCVLLFFLGSFTTAAWAYGPSTSADYHISVQTLLWLDSWRGFELKPVEQTEVWQRLRLRGFDGNHKGTTRTYTVDLEVGTDLGPSGPRLRQEFDQRRAHLDLYAAELWLRNQPWRTELRLGRQLFFDALGFDALDGLTLSIRPVRSLRLDARGGLAVRRGWSKLGPDLFSPDGTRLQTKMGYISGLSLSTLDLKKTSANLSWRQHFDTEILRNEIGASTQWNPAKALSLTASSRVDLLRQQVSHGSASLRWGTKARWFSPSWRFERPTFSADSIWYAFGLLPYQAGQLAAQLSHGYWTCHVDGQVLYFLDETPIEDAHDPLDSSVSDEPSWSHDAGLSIRRRWPAGGSWARAGMHLRTAGGYGGVRHHGDVSLKLPVVIRGRPDKLLVRSRLGATWFEAPNRTEWNGFTAWGLFAGEWGVGRGVNLEGSIEGFSGNSMQRRVRGMARLKVENWW